MKLFAYLSFNGNCEEALNFYKNAFDGEIIQLDRYGDSPMPSKDEHKNKIIHARLQVGDILIMASDVMNDRTIISGDSISLSVDCDTNGQMEKAFASMAEGGKNYYAFARSVLGCKVWDAYR